MISLRRILVPTDFSRHSSYALRAAAALAHDNGASLVVLHVELLRSDYPETGSEAETAYHRDLEREFGRLCEAISGVRVERKTARGEPAAEILGAADELDCDLIAMGTHGRTGLARLLAGSVTEEVLRRSAVPVLAVRSPSPAFRSGWDPHHMFAEHGPHSQPSAVRTILVPTDFSKQSRHAVQAAVALARAYKAKLILLNVQNWNQYVWNESAAGYYESEMALRDYARRRMANLSAELVEVDHECQTVDGNPVDEIIKAADSAECQLIVIGTHGSRGLGRLLFGSVAEGVMRRANCPVLALRSPALFAIEDRGVRLAAASPAAPAPTCQGGCREESEPGPIVVSNHVSCTGGAGVQTHHRAFPEVVGEGATVEEATARLVALFDRARQHDGGEWRRASIEDAFLVAKQYRDSLGGPRRPGAAPPRRDVP